MPALSRRGSEEAMTDGVSAWRESHEPGWHKDIGYVLQDVLRSHHYNYNDKGSKPGDPGWYACTCGTWEGYWAEFDLHVADHLRVVVKSAEHV